MLVGREDERARLNALLDGARAGRSGALLLHGPPGIGKTALLRWAIEAADGLRVLRARGMESESDIPFAGLAELVAPLLALADEIPGVQAVALRGALALGPAAPGDRFTVPAALLSLLARAAEEQPVLAVVDDAQWLDQPSLEAFLFAGRRLEQEGVAILGAAREVRVDVPWLERLEIAPLGEAQAPALLEGDIAPGVADRLLATAAGNPLALLEIPGLLSAGQRAGREPLEDPLRPGTGVERAFAAAVSSLPEGARRALLVAAAAGTRRLDGISVALGQAGLSLGDLEPAEAARIVALAEGELEFRHPLLRSTAYHAASVAERRAAHAALAAAAAEGSAERAWHLAACAVAPDEAVAAALERAALDARERGAHATAARDLGRAAQLTPERGPRALRLLAAAGDALRCGEVERAQGMLDDAAGLTADPLVGADIERMRGRVEMRRGSPVAAHQRLVNEADRVRSRDPRRAAAMLLEASVAHLMTGDLEPLLATAERARALSASAEPMVELLATAVIGEAHVARGDVAQGAPLLRTCEPYLMQADPLAIVEIVGTAAQAAIWMEDWDGAGRLLSRLLGAARAASAVTALIHPLAVQAHLDLRRGRWAPALAGASEAAELAEDAGQLALLPHALAALALVEAGLGHEADCRRNAERGLSLASGDGIAASLHAALGLLELGVGRIPEAIDALETGDRHMLRCGMSSAVVQLRPDLVEAYVRAGRRDAAEDALARLERDAAPHAAGTRHHAAAAPAAGGAAPATASNGGGSPPHSWAAAAAARCRALLAADADVRDAFGAALALHEGRHAVRVGADAPRARRAAAAGQAAGGGAGAAHEGARRVRAARRPAVGRAGAGGAAGHRRPGGRPARAGGGPAAHAARAPDRAAGGSGHDQPGGGRGALPVTQDDRVPPRPDLPEARRPRAVAARAAHGHGAAGGRARSHRPCRCPVMT